MARPRKKLDVELIRKCAEKQWTTEEIAAVTGVHRATLDRRFADVMAEARQSGRAKLRDIQWKRALEGSDRVLLHMSEHYLGQTRVDKVQLTGKDGEALSTTNIAPQVVVNIPPNNRDEK